MSDPQIIEAYHLIHDQLAEMPIDYCSWKRINKSGNVIPNNLNFYRMKFFFILDFTLMDNLAELRMCLDYQLSLYKLHKPGLTFGRQHKLVVALLCASIAEGILTDIFENVLSQKVNHPMYTQLVKQKTESTNFGLGSLIDLFSKSKLVEKNNIEFLSNLNHLRNTVHPLAFNANTVRFDKNPLITKDPEHIISSLDQFIEELKRVFYSKKLKHITF